MNRVTALLAVGIVLGAAAHASAKEHYHTYRGIITAVQSNAVSLIVGDEHKIVRTVTVSVGATTKVQIGDQAGTLGNLYPNMRVEVKVAHGTTYAAFINARRYATYCGTLALVDGNTGEIVLTLPGDRTISFTVDTTTTEILLGDQPGKLSDLTTGMRICVKVDQSTNMAVSVMAPDRQYYGVITSVDAASGTVSLAVSCNRTVELTVDDAVTLITIGDQPATLADLKVGMRICVKVSQSTGTVVSLRAPSEACYFGTIESIDATTGDATLTLRDGTTLAFIIDSTTVIHIHHAADTLDNLVVGMRASVKVIQATGVAVKIEACAPAPKPAP